jgi:hypothetical protein
MSDRHGAVDPPISKGKEGEMGSRSKFFKIWVTALSLAFALLFFFSQYERLGTGPTLIYTILGVGVIWFFYFLWGLVIRSIVDEEIRDRQEKGQLKR